MYSYDLERTANRMNGRTDGRRVCVTEVCSCGWGVASIHAQQSAAEQQSDVRWSVSERDSSKQLLTTEQAWAPACRPVSLTFVSRFDLSLLKRTWNKMPNVNIRFSSRLDIILPGKLPLIHKRLAMRANIRRRRVAAADLTKLTTMFKMLVVSLWRELWYVCPRTVPMLF